MSSLERKSLIKQNIRLFDNYIDIIENRKDKRPLFLLIFLISHVPLAYFISRFPYLATIHVILTFSFGIIFLFFDKNPYRVIYSMAYITGAEILWRVSGANIFWEMGKYSIILLSILAILNFKTKIKRDVWPIFYFLFLIPSVILTPQFDREAIAINLAGPCALAASVLFFSTVVINLEHLKRIFIFLLAPIVGVGSLVMFNIWSLESIAFGSGSNFITSAGFGPNQVSSVLALGSFAAFNYLILEKKIPYQLFYLGITLWLLSQSALTFSRAGVWTTVISLLFSGIIWIRNKKSRLIYLFASFVLIILSYSIILPFLDNYTQGALINRFENINSTGRLEIMKSDLIVFVEHPLFGVGVNQSKSYHALTYRYSSAHTEFTRMLSEHGILGLFALILLLNAIAKRFKLKVLPYEKAFIIGLTMWAILYMGHSATRLVAPSFLFGLATSYFSLVNKEK